MKHNCSAHPKVDKRTGEFFIFGYSLERPIVAYSVFDSKRSLKTTFDVPLHSKRMIHDFMITERFSIVPDLPNTMDPVGAVKNKRFLFHFDKNLPARYGVFPRYAKNAAGIKWFDVEGHFVFHFGNAWDVTNADGHDVVTFFGVVWPDIVMEMQEHLFSPDKNPTFERFDLNLTTGEQKRTILIQDLYLEFPNINQHHYGYKSRFCYISYRDQFANPNYDDSREKDNIFMTGFLKYDCWEHKIVKKVSFGDTHTGGEVFFQQRDGSDPLQCEDDGYVMTLVHDWMKNESQFVMWDAQTLEPVVGAELGQRAPNGFHGLFIEGLGIRDVTKKYV